MTEKPKEVPAPAQPSAEQKPEPKPEVEPQPAEEPAKPTDDFIDRVYADYKERMGKSYDKSLEKMDKKTAILVMQTALALVQKESLKPEKPNNPANPKPIMESPPKNVYIPENRESYKNTLKSTGGYFGASQKLEQKIKQNIK